MKLVGEGLAAIMKLVDVGVDVTVKLVDVVAMKQVDASSCCPLAKLSMVDLDYALPSSKG
jgi:hypothetical protein